MGRLIREPHKPYLLYKRIKDIQDEKRSEKYPNIWILVFRPT